MAKAQSTQAAQAFNNQIKPTLASKFTTMMRQNNLTRLFIYAVIFAKVTMMYDKMKQLVAINNIYAQIINDQKQNFKQVLGHSQLVKEIDGIEVSSQDIIQDFLTRKILVSGEDELDDEYSK